MTYPWVALEVLFVNHKIADKKLRLKKIIKNQKKKMKQKIFIVFKFL